MPSSPGDTPPHRTVGTETVVAVLFALTLACVFSITQQVLAWVFLVVIIVVIWYTVRLVVAMEEVAMQPSRLVDERTDSRGWGDESS